MKKYTVLLLYPDYIAANYGEETYLAHVEAADASDAIARAQTEALNSYDTEYEFERPSDFHPLAVFPGHQDDVKP